VWLLGDERYLRDDAQLFFRKADLPDAEKEKDKTGWQDDPTFCDAVSDVDPEENDYARVLQLINEYLPVSELTGRFVDIGVLRQFGLVENKKVDDFLATVFAPSAESNSAPVTDASTETKVQPEKQNRQRQLNK
jgi:hypothetical protein